MEKKEIIQKLRDSLEISIMKSQMVWSTAIVLIICTLWSISTRNAYHQVDTLPLWGVAFGIVLGPLYMYQAWVLWKIFRCAEHYKFYQTKLSQPRGGLWRDTICFTVLLEDGEDKFVVDTRSIFLTHGIVGPLLEDYVNQTVTVAYNEETEQVVVIG